MHLSVGVIAHVLQPWTSLWIKSQNAVRQSRDQWLCLEGFRDVSAWVQIAQIDTGAAPAVNLETAPTDDEELFSNALSFTPSGPGVLLAVSRATTTTATPLQHYLRWAITGVSAGDFALTFRILVCVNPVVPDFRLTRGDEVFTNPALGGA